MNTKRPRPGESHHELSRRDFLRVAASAGAVGAGAVMLGACGSDDGKGSPTSTPGIVVDPPPETTTIRLGRDPYGPCTAPLYLAKQFLSAEGFTDVQYVDQTLFRWEQRLVAGEMDIHLVPGELLTSIADRSDQLVVLAGIHNTCWELFGGDRVQSLRDLKGKRIGVRKIDANDTSYLFMATLLAYVGIDLENEVELVELDRSNSLDQLAAGTIATLLTIPPYSAVLRANNIGHILLNCMMDAPWPQYFCCMATGNRDFVEKHPVATKRALRAILKAANACAREPERAARYLVDEGFISYDYDGTLATITGLNYAAWREFNPEDTVRFYALRLREAGLVKGTPAHLIARATDWRYLNEIKRELGVA